MVVGIRPEHLTDAALAARRRPPHGARLRGEVELREALGSELLLHVRTDCRPAVTDEVRSVAGDVDEAAVEVLERQAAGGGAMVVARFDSRSRARVGDPVEMAVDVDAPAVLRPRDGQAHRGRGAGTAAAPATAPTAEAAPAPAASDGG